MPKTLKECLQVIGIDSNDERIIHNITSDSRQCDEHSIFIGNKYIEDARNKQAIIIEPKYARQLINFFYDYPSHNYIVIGITGTHGKTSISHYLKQMLTHLGLRCIRLGTHQNEIEDEMIESENTTMDLMNNLEIFMKYKEQIDCIIMEISSIAIEEKRIEFIEFDRIIYTNLSIDHLDYHLTFTQYKYSKFKLRKYLKENGKICLNMDDINLRKLLELERMHILPYHANNYQILYQELTKTIFKYNHQIIQSNMCGEYVLPNLISTIFCIQSMNLKIEYDIISQLKNVDGRMEVLQKDEKIIVIDYAHTPESLKLVCQYLNQFKKNHLITIFGCGGNRDRSKRSLMAKAACENSDHVIVCEDNNRDEKFEEIIKDMHLQVFSNVNIIENRKNAIKSAIEGAQKHDIICIAGKGNEKYLISGQKKIPYNDRETILSI